MTTQTKRTRLLSFLRHAVVAGALLTTGGAVTVLDGTSVANAEAAPKRAKPAPQIHTATIELVERLPQQKTPRVDHYQVAVSDEGQTSRLVHDADGVRTVVEVTWIPRSGPAPLIRLEVQRTEQTGAKGRVRRSAIHSSGRVTPGKGVLFGRIQRHGRGRIDVRLTLS